MGVPYKVTVIIKIYKFHFFYHSQLEVAKELFVLSSNRFALLDIEFFDIGAQGVFPFGHQFVLANNLTHKPQPTQLSAMMMGCQLMFSRGIPCQVGFNVSDISASI